MSYPPGPPLPPMPPPPVPPRQPSAAEAANALVESLARIFTIDLVAGVSVHRLEGIRKAFRALGVQNPFPGLAGQTPGVKIEVLHGRNEEAMKALEKKLNPLRGHGFLDLRGTTGGAMERVQKFLKYAMEHHGVFPYWLLMAADKARLSRGEQVTARAGPFNTLGNIIPRGAVPFVVMTNGECRIGHPLRQGANVTVNHCYVSQMAGQVAFAGELRFGGVLVDNEAEALRYQQLGRDPRTAGTLLSWSNDSGGYRCLDVDASRVGMPMDLYRGFQPVPKKKDYVDYIVRGTGGKINWGRLGPPQSVQVRQSDYWRV